ncbi:guanine nucleotide-binding protein-like 3 homolog [Centruroides sculpturatus]|uniref:guanine nucleotide-binding protein-like 3 homolog n=1 Tax=Centruroides sculpturatus TaxID=218467 RepID=UPI000C6EC014|nr:guanine nucleotide-binding protein-like 3 homolog [Centruroides sculpturatus]
MKDYYIKSVENLVIFLFLLTSVVVFGDSEDTPTTEAPVTTATETTVGSMPDETVEVHSTSTATESTNNPTVTSTASMQPQATHKDDSDDDDDDRIGSMSDEDEAEDEEGIGDEAIPEEEIALEKVTEPETNNAKCGYDADITMKVICLEMLKQYLNKSSWVKYEARQKDKQKAFEKISNAMCYESSKKHWARNRLDYNTYNFISGYFKKFCKCL